MSTRATYEFKGDPMGCEPRVILYKHHDGYPKGAASWLYNAFRVANGRGMATAFLRGNPDAEITTSHDMHGDTDYRWIITPDKGSAGGYMVHGQARRWAGLAQDECSWEPDVGGELVRFITEHCEPDWIEDYSPIISIETSHRTQWITEAAARARLDEQLRVLGIWTVQGPLSMEHANARSVREEITALRMALGSIV